MTLICYILFPLVVFLQEGSSPVAKIGDAPISAAELEKAAGPDLMRLNMQRHQILEMTLNRLLGEKLLDMEAAARGISRSELLKQEIDNKVTEPPLQDINRIYEMNKARIKEPAESVIPRIRESLVNQRKQKLSAALVEDLKRKYQVKTLLEPLRIQVAAAGYPSRGPANAPVTIVLFSDFECPYCTSLNATLNKITAEMGPQVRLVYRNYPLDQIHSNASKAAEASLCAAEQDKFWEMHDELFKDRAKLQVEDLKQKAAAIGLEATRFDSCLSPGKYADRIKADVEAGNAAGVASTPTMFINGRPVVGALPYEEILKIIDEERQRAGAATGRQ